MGRSAHLFSRGSECYAGTGVYGSASTRYGIPLDSFGRNLFVDSYNSAIGPGWQRDNSFLTSFLTHGPNESFCYGFHPRAGRPAAKGEKYRATIQGPGVTPRRDVGGAGSGTLRRSRRRGRQRQEQGFGDPKCRVGCSTFRRAVCQRRLSGT
jgi:hypothetical protein